MKLIILFFFGASLGSFLGLVIDRFPHESIIFPASHCNHCKKQLKAWDLIPILSQIWRKSRCGYCQAKIPIWYALFESLTGILVLLLESGSLSLSQFLLVLAGLVLAIYDIKHREYPLMVWLVFAGLVLALLGFNLPFFLFLLLAILAEIFPLKMGSGDFLYMALIALVFSVTDLLWVIQISSFLGILFAALFQQKSQPIPFIPFLLIGLICYLPLVSFVF